MIFLRYLLYQDELRLWKVEDFGVIFSGEPECNYYGSGLMADIVDESCFKIKYLKVILGYLDSALEIVMLYFFH